MAFITIEKINILGAVLELPAKQQSQFSPFGPIFEVKGLDWQLIRTIIIQIEKKKMLGFRNLREKVKNERTLYVHQLLGYYIQHFFNYFLQTLIEQENVILT